MDLVWLDGRPFVMGADTKPLVWAAIGAPACGIRLRPGMAGAVLGLPAYEVRDQQIPLAQLWPSTSEWTDGTDPVEPSGRLRLLAEAVLHRRAEPDPLIGAAVRRLGVPGARVAAVAADLGVSERHLNRLVSAAVGYGPKFLARVARLRGLIAAGEPVLADRALAAGYASQAHMADEVRCLTGLTAVRFLEDAALTAA
ncbi:helix-turn-helix protein [Tamaricihabitans halophyticus]|uniref:Helix-turn-helix protein n=1 Tax=Tamaricihabitans halophyticus TaxID=1262583 RepID=A0A4R2QUJ1_9PSEU|nr:helix-turn-helix domain-containing protein [Tamaricihabitans halophyticus]TCP53662.1 helix-turn-helix protein [Tamaricihabitans halophyticus]